MPGFNIYGLRAGIQCNRSKEEREISALLALFPGITQDETDVVLKFKKKQRAQEIGALIYPHLAARNIWAMHSGGFHYRGGRLTIGPSNCGKSTFTSIALENDLPVLSDDITLMRQVDGKIELLPFYAKIFMNDRVLVPETDVFKPGILESFILPKKINGTTYVKKLGKRSDLLKRLVPQLLWSYEGVEKEGQKNIIEKLCDYPAFEVYWGPDIFKKQFDFKGLLDEVV